MLGPVRRHPQVAALAGYAVLAAAATWPLLPRFTSGIAGGAAESSQALWQLWWWKESLGRGASPFFCDLLRWPAGVPLWLAPGDLTAAAAVLPLWPLTPALPEFALYNAALFASYALAGFAAHHLCRELWGGHLAPFLAGALYAVSAYAIGAAVGPVQVLSLQWSPLYFLGLVRTVRRHGAGGPLLAGAALALAAAASVYHLAFCAVGTAVLLAAWFPVDRATILSGAFVRRALLAVATFLLLGGWLFGGVLRAMATAPVATDVGAAAARSSDLLAWFVPGEMTAWGAALDRWLRPARTDAAPAGYLGLVAVALAVAAGVRSRAARPWLAVSLAGLVLALGPRLRVAGRELGAVPLPYAALEAAVPSAHLGVPPRFGWLVAFGMGVAACGALSLVVRSGRRGPALACALAAVAIADLWPRPSAPSSWPAPSFLRDWAKDGERWAVLDATDPRRQLWHQVLHRHPQVGGRVGPAAERGAPPPALRALLGDGGSLPSRDAAVRALQDLNVRYVIVDGDRLAAGRALRVRRAFEGEGLVVYEVPPRG